MFPALLALLDRLVWLAVRRRGVGSGSRVGVARVVGVGVGVGVGVCAGVVGASERGGGLEPEGEAAKSGGGGAGAKKSGEEAVGVWWCGTAKTEPEAVRLKL